MNILQKYLCREWLWAFLSVTAILLIVLLGVFLGELLGDVADGNMPPGLLSRQLLLRFPEALGTVLPLSAFIAIMVGLGRLYRDQEMAVMRASGFSWVNLLRPLFVLLVPVSFVLLANGLLVAPKAADIADKQLEQAFRSAALWGLQAGRFHVIQNGDRVVYAEAIEEDGRTLRNVFIQQRSDGREQVWTAKSGQYWLDPNTGDRYLTLEDGQITDGSGEALDFGILRFDRNDLRLPQPESNDDSVSLKATTSAELWQASSSVAKAEFEWRISPAVAVLVLGLLAIPLSHSEPREGRGGRLVLGLLSYALYANLLNLSRVWIAEDQLPTYLGIWWVHLVVFVVALFWLQQQGRMPHRT